MDWLDGGAGDDILYSGRASDKQVDGGDGNDRIFTDRGNDPASGGPGADFNGDFDAGFRGWYVQSLSSRATLFPSAFEGSQAARFEVRQGDVEPDTGSQRSEVSGPTFKEGQDLYIPDAIRVPSSNTEVWLDGVQQKMANGQTRIYGQTIQAAETYIKAGTYRSKSSTGTSVVEHDAIIIGTSYSAVMAG